MMCPSRNMHPKKSPTTTPMKLSSGILALVTSTPTMNKCSMKDITQPPCKWNWGVDLQLNQMLAPQGTA